MKITNKILALVLTATICLSLLLSACTNGSSSPSPSVSDAGTTPDNTQTPGNTPDTTTPDPTPNNTTEPSSSPNMPKEPVVFLPDPTSLNEETKALIDKEISRINNLYEIDIDELIGRAYEKYGSYLNENITINLIRIGVITGSNSSYYTISKTNLTGISEIAMQTVNNFLEENGEEPIEIKNHEQNIAALWIAASLYYDSYYDDGTPYFEVAMPFGLARADSSEGDAHRRADSVWSLYVRLFNLF